MGLLGSDDPDDEISELVGAARSDTVTRDVLEEPKGGIAMHNLGYEPIVDFLDDGEQPHFVLFNATKGVRIHDGEREQTLRPKGRRRAFAVLTDRRILYLVGSDEVKEVDLRYTDVKAFETRTGTLKHRLLVRDHSVFADFAVSPDNLDDGEMERVESFLDEQTDETIAGWLEETEAISRLSASDEPVVEGEAERDDELVTMAENGGGMAVKVYPDRVEFARKEGAVFNEIQREFYYDSLYGVEFAEGKGIAGRGYLHLNLAGVDGGTEVLFRPKFNEQFREAKEAIQERLHGDPAPDDESSTETDPAIEKLREQYAIGEISEEEYEERLAVLTDE